MGVEELLQTAWMAVKEAGVPESLQEAAFKEAVAYLRDVDDKGGKSRAKRSQKRPDARKPSRSSASGSQASGPEERPPDEDAFFSQLASESGVNETVLRDVLQLKEGNVHVIPPTRELGGSKAEQTRRVIALVAGAYAHGLDRTPVDAEAVRTEAKRKRCFDTANFAATLKKLKGFNSGSNRNEIMVGAKWRDEFEEAVAAVTGTEDK